MHNSLNFLCLFHDYQSDLELQPFAFVCKGWFSELHTLYIRIWKILQGSLANAFQVDIWHVYGVSYIIIN